jgi:DHA1 family tetracycline resistance protein-like MFS transporter
MQASTPGRRFLLQGRAPSVPFVFVTVLIDIIGIGLIIPVLPLIVGEFTSSPDAQAKWYGVLAACFGLMQFLFAPLLGALSDRFGRRPLLLLGIAGMAFNFVVTAFATSLWMLLGSRLVGGALAGNLAVANAYIADITPPEDRARRFGLLGAAFGMGFIIGPVIGGLLGSYDLRWPFMAAAILCVVNWCYGFLVLPESLPKERRSPVNLKKCNPLSSLVGLVQLKGVGSLVAVIAISNFSQFMLHTTWVLYVGHRFGWGPRETGLSLFAVGVSSAVVQGGLLGPLLKWLGPYRLAVAGLLSQAVAYTGYGLITQGWQAYALILGNFLSLGVAAALQSVVSRAAAPEHQGATLGALSSMNSLMLVLAPMVAAPLYGEVSHFASDDWRVGTPLFVASALSMLACMLALHHFKSTPPNHTPMPSEAK